MIKHKSTSRTWWELSYLKVRQVRRSCTLYILSCKSGGGGGSITLLIAMNKQQTDDNSNNKTCSAVSKNQDAISLVARCLSSKESMGTDNIAEAVSNKDKRRTNNTLYISFKIYCRHLYTKDERDNKTNTGVVTKEDTNLMPFTVKLLYKAYTNDYRNKIDNYYI